MTTAKVFISTLSLGCGGTERVVSRLVEAWSKDRRLEMTVAVFDEKAATFFPPPDEVSAVYLGRADWSIQATSRTSLILNTVRKILSLRRLLARDRPDVILSFGLIANCLTLLAGIGLGLRVYVSVRHDPRAYKFAFGYRAAERVLYIFARAIVIPSRHLIDGFPRSWRKRLLVLPNPIAIAGDAVCSLQKDAFILSVGRLSAEKGHEKLLHAFPMVLGRVPRARLVLYGEGPLRPSMEKLAADLGLKNAVTFRGAVPLTRELYSRARVFVLPSLTEAWPNAAAEALASGVPVVAYDTGGGIRDLVLDNRNGFLVPIGDVAGLATRIVEILTDDGLAKRLSVEAASSMTRYDSVTVATEWARQLEFNR